MQNNSYVYNLGLLFNHISKKYGERIAIVTENDSFDYNYVNKLSNKYPTFGGVFVWEYINSPPAGPLNPGLWSVYMYQAIHNNLILKVNKSIDTCELEDYIDS